MRKPLVILGKILVMVLMLFALYDRAFAAEKLTKIAENVYAYVGTQNSSKNNSFGANAGIIIGKDGIVVVDTMISAKEAKRFIRDIRTISRKPIRYAVLIAKENARKAMENSAGETLENIGNNAKVL